MGALHQVPKAPFPYVSLNKNNAALLLAAEPLKGRPGGVAGGTAGAGGSVEGTAVASRAAASGRSPSAAMPKAGKLLGVK